MKVRKGAIAARKKRLSRFKYNTAMGGVKTANQGSRNIQAKSIRKTGMAPYGYSMTRRAAGQFGGAKNRRAAQLAQKAKGPKKRRTRMALQKTRIPRNPQYIKATRSISSRTSGKAANRIRAKATQKVRMTDLGGNIRMGSRRSVAAGLKNDRRNKVPREDMVRGASRSLNSGVKRRLAGNKAISKRVASRRRRMR